jgi:hypothetical protein
VNVSLSLSLSLSRRAPLNSGIAVGPILFVIAILAVLVGAISSGSGGFGSNTSPERAKILAAQIINQAQQVKNAVDRVRANGCSDEEISFENGVVSGYTNPNSPLASKPWCHVFQPNGGGITWQRPPIVPTYLGVWRYNGSNVFAGVGSGSSSLPSASCPYDGTLCVELGAFLYGIPQNICYEISKLTSTLTPSDSIPIDRNAINIDNPFVGVYWQSNNSIGDVAGQTTLQGKTIGCAQFEGQNTYFFFAALVAR